MGEGEGRKEKEGSGLNFALFFHANFPKSISLDGIKNLPEKSLDFCKMV